MQTNKTLIQINTVSNTGSTGRIVEGIGVASIQHDYKSVVAYGRGKAKSQSELIRIGSHFNIIQHVIKTRLYDKHGLGSCNATKKLIEKIDQIKPSIVHLHNLHGYYLNIELLINYLNSLKIPIVWTFHDCWPITGHCVHFDFVKCDKWKNECSKCVQKNRYPASYFLDRSSKNFKLKNKLINSIENLTIVTVSSWLAEIVRQSFLINIPLIKINNGIDTSVFQQISNKYFKEKFNLEGRFVILGVASKWDYRKGLDDFIELSKLLDDNFAIVLVGLTRKQIIKLPKNMLGITRTENLDELVGFYNAADVYFNASVEETFGLTTIEAMACGTPVIVYNATACPEVVSCDTGFITKKKNLNEVIEAIITVKKRGKDYYSKACIQRVKSLYDNNKCYSEYLTLYNSLIC